MSKRKKTSHKDAGQAKYETPMRSSPPLYVLAGAALIILAAVFTYLPSIRGGFILDDDLYLTRNNIVKASDGLYRFWCTLEAEDYWPMTYTSFWIDWRLWGMNPTGYHVLNLVLHIVASLLIWLVLRRLSIPGAFWAALIFALHPVNVESVAWISQRKNNLAMLFFLLSILWYLKFLKRAPRPTFSRCPVAAKQALATVHCPLTTSSSFYTWYFLSLAAFVLAMLGKGSVAVLPVLLLGILWWQRASISISSLLRIAPFFLVSVALTVLNLWTQTQNADTMHPTAAFIERLLGAGGVVWFYLFKALLPLNLVFIYPQWQIQAGNPLWWLPLAAVLAVTAVLWLYRNTWSRPLLFAWGFFCVSLVPVLGLTQVGFMKYSLVADHYQHIALIAAIALASAGLSVWHQQARATAQRAATIVAIAAVVALALLTWRQSGLYRDEITLYQDTLEKNPNCWLAHVNLAFELIKTGHPQEAIENCEQALRIKPDSPEAHNNLGLFLDSVGRSQEAIEHFEKALRLKPDFAEAHVNFGSILVQAGRPADAIEHYRQALLLKPNDADVQNSLGSALLDTGRPAEAMDYFKKALQLNPDLPEARYNLGLTLLKTGRSEEAIEQFRQALRLKPDNLSACNNLAMAYAKTGQSTEAIAAARRALEIARSQGKTTQVKQIEDWLNAYQRTGMK
jgi:protein O-mannosyl-transferase